MILIAANNFNTEKNKGKIFEKYNIDIFIRNVINDDK